MKRNPIAIKTDDGDSVFTVDCKTKEEAKKLIEEELCCEIEEIENGVININEIKEDKVFHCSECEYYTVGDFTCNECNETCDGAERKTFIYSF